jgi:hypothetical protein
MNTRAILFTVGCMSLVTNYFTAPIAGPVLWDSVKMATSNHLIVAASALRPQSPTVVPAVDISEMKESRAKGNAMPPRMDVGKLAAAMPEANVDVIAQLLESN